MKSRIALLLIISGLWTFLFIFQNYMSTCWAIVFLLSFMIAYSLYMQIAYKHQKRKLRKNPIVYNKDFAPFVSIMIPAHNEGAVIAETVENILAIDYENFEIIIIDDRSTDNTATVIKSLEEKYDKVVGLIRNENDFPGKSAVLNDATKIAKGDFFLIFDADARINPDFLKQLLPYMETDDVGAVQARKCISNRDENFLTRCQDNEYAIDTHFQMGRDAVRGAVELRGNGQLIRRTAVADIDGWNNNTITDDLDMSTRMHIKGWDVRFVPSVCVYEEGITSFVPLLRQRRRWIEGSIRRYLEHFAAVITSKDMSIRVTFDMTAYISEFILPVWMMSELVFQAFNYYKKYDNTLSSSLIVLACIGIFFFLGSVYSLKKYNKLSAKNCIIQSIETDVYFVTIWFPLVVYIIPKIIFFKKSLAWGKTQHGVSKTTIHPAEISEDKTSHTEETEKELISV